MQWQQRCCKCWRFHLDMEGGGWLAYEYSLPLELSDEDEDLRTLNAL